MNIALALILAVALLAVVAAGLDAIGSKGNTSEPCEPLISNTDIFIAERTFLS